MQGHPTPISRLPLPLPSPGFPYIPLQPWNPTVTIGQLRPDRRPEQIRPDQAKPDQTCPNPPAYRPASTRYTSSETQGRKPPWPPLRHVESSPSTTGLPLTRPCIRRRTTTHLSILSPFRTNTASHPTPPPPPPLRQSPADVRPQNIGACPCPGDQSHRLSLWTITSIRSAISPLIAVRQPPAWPPLPLPPLARPLVPNGPLITATVTQTSQAIPIERAKGGYVASSDVLPSPSRALSIAGLHLLQTQILPTSTPPSRSLTALTTLDAANYDRATFLSTPITTTTFKTPTPNKPHLFLGPQELVLTTSSIAQRPATAPSTRPGTACARLPAFAALVSCIKTRLPTSAKLPISLETTNHTLHQNQVWVANPLSYHGTEVPAHEPQYMPGSKTCSLLYTRITVRGLCPRISA